MSKGEGDYKLRPIISESSNISYNQLGNVLLWMLAGLNVETDDVDIKVRVEDGVRSVTLFRVIRDADVLSCPCCNGPAHG